MYSDCGYPLGWVAPFGDPGINDRSHLPRAFRSVPRPSSPLSAKASTRCPYFALERHTQRQGPSGSATRQLRADIAEVTTVGATNIPSSEDTLSRDPPAARPTRPLRTCHAAARGLPLRSHILASLRLSISSMPRRRQTAPERQFLVFAASSRSPLGVAAQTCRRPIAGEPRGKSGAFTGSGGDRNRTDDPLLAKQVLSQLSYTPGAAKQHRRDRRNHRFGRKRGPLPIRRPARNSVAAGKAPVVGQGGFEPPTSRLSSARSNQLSY